jgi:hypothetical protein
MKDTDGNKSGMISKEKFCLFLKDYVIKVFTPMVIVTLLGIFVALEANKIASIQTMSEIVNLIQLRTDMVLAIEHEREEFHSQNIPDFEKSSILKEKSNEAIKMMLNTYEYACMLYNKKKINREIFKLYYYEIIEDYMERYNIIINPNQPEPYSAIKKVYKEWIEK